MDPQTIQNWPLWDIIQLSRDVAEARGDTHILVQVEETEDLLLRLELLYTDVPAHER
ncbi:hypothetical protein SynSYN20_01590 [Synechococcus sp. SYN20]|uniref:hypothetical protein n=1 Tax=Synechococcus sp. SYN20 TaxID=1050714 RepID=UPI0016465BA6|nr:hypothetical protein [Synechococcus sp. SYN20]QNJ25917.1 hypothetical protein SynSYN20_01590 [Synechococcus sp. SYN20]